MERTLNQLTLTANGAVGTWGPDAGMRKGESRGESRAPTASDTWTVEQLAWDYSFGATTHRARFRVILEAQTLVRKMKRADPSLIKGTEAWKARIAADSRPYRVLADEYGISLRDVVAYKKAAG
jgi:hypothetical protein